MFTLCNSFEEYKQLGFKQAEENMHLFERALITDGNIVHKRSGAKDGEWAKLSEYQESDFNNVPDQYPVVIYSKVIETFDRLNGISKIWIWEWTPLSQLSLDK